MDQADFHHFMAQHRYGVISSIAENGTPQSALVGIAVNAELEVFFDTIRSSRKYPNLIARPGCAFVVGWGGEQTVQYEGVAFEAKGSDLKRYQEVYFPVWPDAPQRVKWPDLTYFIVRPRWVRYSDYDRNPPLIEELTFQHG